MEHHIKIRENIQEDYYSIIDDYWHIGNDDFVSKPKQLTEKYNISLSDLNKIIKDYSVCTIVIGYCEDCGIEISKTVFSQTSFKEAKRQNKKRCSDCDTKF